jgi:predicted ester cyclase
MVSKVDTVIRDFYRDAFGEGRINIAAIDHYMAADFTAHHLARHQDGREAYKRFIRTFMESFSDMDHLVICDLFRCDEKVAARWSWPGKHTAEFMGIPATYRQVTIRGIDIFRVAGGKIVDLWQEVDRMYILQQIMALPMPDSHGH